MTICRVDVPRIFLAWFFLVTAGFLPVVHARVLIDITQGSTDPLPVAVTDFTAGTEQEVRLGQDISRVVTGNLERSGLFRPLDPDMTASGSGRIVHEGGINSRPVFADWRLAGARVLVVGEVTGLPDGRIHVATRLWDIAANTQLGAVAFKTPAANWRRVAHKVSDFIYGSLTGEEGYFDTRIVFVHETGPREDRVKRLMIMDQDGANPVPLTDGTAYQVLTPRFSPAQQQITYMALFDDRPGQVYLMNIGTGEQEQLGTFRGMTFAPRFSPDGSRVIMSLERGGNSDIFVMHLGTRRLTRLTVNPSIDTSPSMSPDGKLVAFTSDRGGSQQIYVMNSDGSRQKRITYGEGRYQTPVWSPRGDLIAFTRQHAGRFYIGVIRPDGSGERLLTESYLEDGPAWAPNGRVLMFFRQTPAKADGSGGGSSLWSVDLTGRNMRRIRTPADASDPAWSPLLP